jgi:hypothetical protein
MTVSLATSVLLLIFLSSPFTHLFFSVKDTLVANCYTNVASHVQHQHHQQQLQDHQQDHQAQQSSNNCSSLPFATRSLSAGPMKAP